MSKHSPGPFVIRYGGTMDADGFTITTLDKEVVCEYWPLMCIDKARMIADANLFKAAPDLLAELTHLVRLLDPLERDGGLNVPGLATLNAARNAIAKAEGR